MPLIIQGAGGVAVGAGPAEASAGLHITARPLAGTTLGAYRVAPLSGAIAAGLGANSELLQFRWTDATRFAVIHKLYVTGIRATTAFAVGGIDITATIARSFSAAGTGGGTLTLSGDNQAMRTIMGTSLVTEIRVATTAALGAGTKTLDANEIGRITTHSSAGPGGATPIVGSIYLPNYDLLDSRVASGEYPVTLAASEGLIVRATVPATGVWNIGFELVWSEVAAY